MVDGKSFVFSYPYWIFVDNTSNFHETVIKYNGLKVRVYPFFRSAPANYSPLPIVNSYKIPHTKNTDPNFFVEKNVPVITVYPVLGVDEKGGASTVGCWGMEWDNPPKDFPMDSLRIDIVGASESDVEKIANRINIEFIQLIRWYTKQWWMGRSVDGLVGHTRLVFDVMKSGIPVGDIAGIGKVRTVNGDEISVNQNIWEAVMEDLEKGVVPPLYDDLLLDAQYNLATNDLRRSVLDAAIACEQKKDLTFEMLWKIKNPGLKYKREDFSGYYLPSFLGSVMEENFGHSYEKDFPNNFKTLKELWFARNNIAHGGHSKTNVKKIYLTEQKVQQYIKLATHCIEWLEELKNRYKP